MTDFHDDLVTPGTTVLPDGFFDRFVVNLHPTNGSGPSVIVGCGLHPGRGTVDGFAVVVTGAEQRNVRFYSELGSDWSRCGPLSWEVVDPNEVWRLRLGDNPTGVGLDVVWRARAPYWSGTIDVANAGGRTTSFDHLFQSGLVDGTLTVDGRTQAIEQWYSQRDRSRGVRSMSGGQGLHLWFQANFADCSVGFLLVEARDGSRILVEGAVMHTDGAVDPVRDVRHRLQFDDLDLRYGDVEVTTQLGAVHRIACDASARGGLMAGAGYGGHHGLSKGIDHVEGETYPLDGTVTQRTVDSSLTDRLTVFDMDGAPGAGIFEFALSRSPSYSYRPSLQEP